MNSFNPNFKTLMGPGPSNIDPRVLQAMARPIIGHLDPQFIDLMDEIKALLRYAYQTENGLTFPVSAPGSAGMEACFANLVEPGDKVLVCINGVFGGRMKENVIRCGGEAVIVEDAWGTPVSCDKVEDALKANPDIKILAFVHAETSTGVCSDGAALAKLAQEHDCLSIMDCVTSLAGVPVMIDEWGVDAAYSGSQKCLSCPPGLSPVTFSEHAIDHIRKRNTQIQSWFLDLSLVMDYWSGDGARSYHHTAPINAMYALHESLLLVREEGLEAAWARHKEHHEALKAGLEKLGLSLLVDEAYRLPQMNSVLIPDALKPREAEIRKTLLAEHNLEIGAGLGALAGQIWRIGLMGFGASEENVRTCLDALEDVL
jgi:alanine-glyoxylate transaminase / serine-glyoxylate transaminase / serine-pyruvate transaminase